jgi:hypothetical protein
MEKESPPKTLRMRGVMELLKEKMFSRHLPCVFKLLFEC